MTNELDDSPGAARKRVHERYKAYGERVDAFSIQFCYALIAANWALFESTKGILSNPYATWSLVLVLFTLGATLLTNTLITAALARRVDGAYKNEAKWNQEYEDAKRTHDIVWPYTRFILWGADLVRWGKTVLPLVAGVLLLLGIICRNNPPKTKVSPSCETTSCCSH
jgi:hypothetical protein